MLRCSLKFMYISLLSERICIRKPHQLALAEGTFYKVSRHIYLAVRTFSHLITSVADTVMSTPYPERCLTKFFTTPVFRYAEETPSVSLSP